jgi:hypothetical protein
VWVYYCITKLCLFITAGPSTKLFTWGAGDMGGHVLRETTSRGLCVFAWGGHCCLFLLLLFLFQGLQYQSSGGPRFVTGRP